MTTPKSFFQIHATDYEHEVIKYHMQRNENTCAWHWTRVPCDEIIQCGYLPDLDTYRKKHVEYKKFIKSDQETLTTEQQHYNFIRDYGLDGLSKTITETECYYTGIQAKYYADKCVCESDICTFFDVIDNRLNLKNPKNGGILYSRTAITKSLADKFASEKRHIQHIQYDWTPSVIQSPIQQERQARSGAGGSDSDDEDNQIGPLTSRKLPITASHHVNEHELPLRSYQQNCLNKLIEKQNTIQCISLPPGSGKSKLLGHFLQELDEFPKILIIMAPLRISVTNLFTRIPQYLDAKQIKYKTLLVNTDGITDELLVENFMYKKGKYSRVIFTTFESVMNVVNKILEKNEKTIDEDGNQQFQNPMLIVDEAHNVITRPNLIDFINKFTRGILMTGTLPATLAEQVNIINNVQLSFREALEQKILVNYTLWLPIVKNNEDKDDAHNIDIAIPDMFSDLPAELVQKAIYLQTCMIRTGSRKCIIFLTSQSECAEFLNVLNNVMHHPDFINLEFWGSLIDSNTTEKDRSCILEEFQSPDTDREIFRVIASIHILDEAVDIPSADSVFITNISESSCNLRFVQRTMRSARVDPKNPSKHNNIFVWADGSEKQLQVLNFLRENDPDMIKKIRCVRGDYDTEDSFPITQFRATKQKLRIEKVIADIQTYEAKCELIIEEIAAFYELNRRPPMKEVPEEKKYYDFLQRQKRFYKEGILDTKLGELIRSKLPWFVFAKPIPEVPKTETELQLELLYNTYNHNNTIAMFSKTISVDLFNGLYAGELKYVSDAQILSIYQKIILPLYNYVLKSKRTAITPNKLVIFQKILPPEFFTEQFWKQYEKETVKEEPIKIPKQHVPKVVKEKIKITKPVKQVKISPTLKGFIPSTFISDEDKRKESEKRSLHITNVCQKYQNIMDIFQRFARNERQKDNYIGSPFMSGLTIEQQQRHQQLQIKYDKIRAEIYTKIEKYIDKHLVPIMQQNRKKLDKLMKQVQDLPSHYGKYFGYL